jgi:SAM-dependent methyltransferase
MLWLFHRLMDIGWVYRLAQVFGRPTVRRYRMLVEKHVPQSSDRRVLEIGCGIGSSRPLFQADYTGIDINSDYIRIARQTMTGAFEVMDAAQMSFAPNSFDDAVSIATGHHLSDDQLVSMIRKATNVAATLHIIDSILPVSPHAYFKTALFRMDRGQHIRTFDRLGEIVSHHARMHAKEVLEGPLHDVCYIRASRVDPAPAAAPAGDG